ncbi:MAG: hypothetical protein AAB456_03440 [Patescibacteria group bacterium]
MNSRRCREVGHQWHTDHEDENYTYEECLECGARKRFCKHDNRNAYAQEHSIDMIQLWDERFALIYPDTLKRLAHEKKDLEKSEDEAGDKLDRAKHAVKKMYMSSKFVH